MAEVKHPVPIAQDQVGMYYQQPGQQLGNLDCSSGQYFMMGDNRDNSADSRYWGLCLKRIWSVGQRLSG